MEFIDIPRDVPEHGPERLARMSELVLMDEEASLVKVQALLIALDVDDETNDRLIEVDSQLSEVEEELMRRGFPRKLFP